MLVCFHSGNRHFTAVLNLTSQSGKTGCRAHYVQYIYIFFILPFQHHSSLTTTIATHANQSSFTVCLPAVGGSVKGGNGTVQMVEYFDCTNGHGVRLRLGSFFFRQTKNCLLGLLNAGVSSSATCHPSSVTRLFLLFFISRRNWRTLRGLPPIPLLPPSITFPVGRGRSMLRVRLFSPG